MALWNPVFGQQFARAQPSRVQKNRSPENVRLVAPRRAGFSGSARAYSSPLRLVTRLAAMDFVYLYLYLSGFWVLTIIVVIYA